MKKLLSLLLIVLMASCKPTPEFYIDGKPYYTRTYCVQSHTEQVYGYHYGYNWLKGKYEYHLGWYTETVCDRYRTDTLEIKP